MGGTPQFQGFMSWPHIESIEMQKKTNGNVQLSIVQKTIFYGANGDNYFSKVQPDLYASVSLLPAIPKETFNILYNPTDLSTEILRSYEVPLPDGDFEVQKITDTQSDRYVRMRLNIPDSINILNKMTSIHLIARDLETTSKLSIGITQYQMINTDEVLLEFKVPQRNIALNQLLIPLTDSKGMYYELSLRPSKPQILYGSEALNPSELKIHTFTINKKKKKTDSLKAIIQLNSKKTITGITLEVDQIARAKRVSWINSTIDQQTKDPLSYIGVGRKFYFDQKNFLIRSNQNENKIILNIPESNISIVQSGPEHTTISWWIKYTQTHRYKGETLTDTQERSITNAWVHFSDGSYEKIEKSKLPENFSLISQEEERAQKKQAKSSAFSWREHRKMFDLDIKVKDFFEDAKPLDCKSLFKK